MRQRATALLRYGGVLVSEARLNTSERIIVLCTQSRVSSQVGGGCKKITEATNFDDPHELGTGGGTLPRKAVKPFCRLSWVPRHR